MMELLELSYEPLLQTLYMVAVSTFLSTIIGLPLGIILTITNKNHIWQHDALNKILNVLVNAFRSMPFLILMIVVLPATKMIVGTRIGTTAAIVPLTVAAIPFIARLAEGALKDVNWGLIEAALSMGASIPKIIWDVLISESLPALVLVITTTSINLIGYSAMAGALGGGGLGDLAMRYGYQGFRGDVIFSTVIILLVLVQLIQIIGDTIRKKIIK